MEVPFPRQVWNLHLLRTRTSQHQLDSAIDREQADRPGRREANTMRASDETANSATRVHFPVTCRHDPAPVTPPATQGTPHRLQTVGGATIRPNDCTARAPEASFRKFHGLAEGGRSGFSRLSCAPA